MKEQTYLDVFYHSDAGGYPKLLAKYLVFKYLNHAYDRTMLDIGTGKGDMAKAFEAHGLQVTGINKSECDLETEPLQFARETFDYVFSKSCIEHIWNTDHLLAETYRVLKPGGRAIFMTPDWATDYKMFYDDPTHVKPFTQKGLRTAFIIAGFKNVKVEGFYQLPFLWRHRCLTFIVRLIQLLPDSWKYKRNGEQIVWIRHSKERMILLVTRKESLTR